MLKMNTQEIAISFDTIMKCGTVEEVMRIEEDAVRINIKENKE